MDVFYSILMLLTGIGIFLVGIVMFSGCLEKLASRKMRTMLRKISNNRFAGLGVGAAVTTVIQSSTATSVMTIGLVNAGILTLFQATAIIMGSNIGSAISTLLVALSVLKIKYFFMAMAFVGAFIRIFTKKETWLRAAEILISFGILFVGLQLMGEAFSTSNGLTDAFQTLFSTVTFPLLLILLGAIFAAILQSTTASTAVFVSMISGGFLIFDSALWLVLGSKLGAVLIVIISSFSANTNAKRSALIFVLFNAIGVIMCTALIWPFSDFLISFYTQFIPDPVWQLSLFHVIVNIFTAAVLIWFVKPLNMLTVKLIKDKPNANIMQPNFISDAYLLNPQTAIEQTKKEIVEMAGLAKDNLENAFSGWTQQNILDKKKLIKQENRVDFLYHALKNYIIKIPKNQISVSNRALINSYYLVIDEIEKISDDAQSIMSNAEIMQERNIILPENAILEFNEMYTKVVEFFNLSMDAVEKEHVSKLRSISNLKREIDKKANILAELLIVNDTNEDAALIVEHFYVGIISLKRVKDHISNMFKAMRTVNDKKPAKKKNVIIQTIIKTNETIIEEI